jgi:hypothetical protein
LTACWRPPKTTASGKVERETADLPATMEEAVPFFRLLLRQHHAAMLAADVDTAMCLRRGAELLALRQLASWGQAGEFTITVDTMQVRSELDGLFGIGSGRSFWPGFAAHAVDHDRPS